MNRNIKDYLRNMDKETAIRAMMDGYAVVETAQSTKMEYDGHCLVWYKEKFCKLSTDLKTTNIDVNLLPHKFFSLWKFTDTMIPQTVWKSNVDTSSIHELTFHRILETGHEVTSPLHSNTMWVICDYRDEFGNQIGVKFEKTYNIKTRRLRKDIDIVTNAIDFTKKDASKRLRYWVDEQLKFQRKAGKGRVLKTTPKAQKIIDELPEIFM